MDPVTAIALLSFGFQFIYHRFFSNEDRPNPASEIRIPRTDEGAPIPLIYGLCMVKAPILAWIGPPVPFPIPGPGSPWFPQHPDLDAQTYWQGAPYLYGTEALYVVGMIMDGGTAKIQSIYAAEQRLPDEAYGDTFPLAGYVRLNALVGGGNFETDTKPCFVWGHPLAATQGPSMEIGGFVEFLNGGPTQQLVDPTTPYASTTVAGERMSLVMDPSIIPGYRGFLSMFFGGVDDFRWFIGSNPDLQNYSFVAGSWPAGDGLYQQMGFNVNPIDVIYDMLTDTRKLGYPTSRIDYDNFVAAARTLFEEGHGYARSIEETRSAESHIQDILKQIDGVMYEDPTTGLLKIKLIRPDYVFSQIPLITNRNCESLESFSAGSWTDTYTRIKVVFTNRSNNYREASAVAQNQANAVGAINPEVRDLTLQFPGVTDISRAKIIAARELAARSRPIMRCRAVVGRSFFSQTPGNALRVSWPNYNLDQVVFRIAKVDKGTMENGQIALELIQDFFYTYNSTTSHSPTVGSFPSVAVIE